MIERDWSGGGYIETMKRIDKRFKLNFDNLPTRVLPIEEEHIEVCVVPKNSKARKVVIEHGNIFELVKLTSVGQYLRSRNSYYKKDSVFSWEGWLYDADIDFDNPDRTELRMRILK